MERKIKTAVIGLGKMGILHTAIVNMIPDAELKAVADTNRQLATYVQQSGLKARFFSDVDEMLAEEPLDAALIVTPGFANREVAEKCLAKGLDVFVEKPLAHTFADAKVLAALAEARKGVYATGYLLAHWALFKKARQVLADGCIGGLFRYKATMYTSEVFGRKKGWTYDKEKAGGGALMAIGSHLLYVLYWYFGRPARVFAQAPSFYSADVEDAATALFDYDSGLRGLVDVNWSLPGYRLPYVEITAEGDNGVLELTNDHLKLHLYKPGRGFAKDWTTIHKIDMPSSSRFELGAEGLYEEDQEFISRCLDRKRPAVTWADGLEVQRMIEAVYRSSAERRTIALGDVR